MAEHVTSRPLAEVAKRLHDIEQALGPDIDINERVNILSYAIAGYVIAMSPPGEREATAKAIGRAITFVCLPVMTPIVTRSGGDFETLNRRPS